MAVARRTDPETVIRSQVMLEEHDVSADGRFAVVVRRFVQCDRYRSHLWLIPLAGPNRRPVQLTSGRVRDTFPRVAPDGSAVAFKRAPATACPERRAREGSAVPRREEDDATHLFILPLRRDARPGTEWAVNTPAHRSVGDVAWSPDGRRLALTIEAGPPRLFVGPEPAAGTAPLARRITRLDWRWDEQGFLDRRSHVHVVERRRQARPRQLTAGDYDAAHLAWAPDGQSIAFDADPRPDADLVPRRSIWRVNVDGEEPAAPAEVLRAGGDVHSPAFSTDGRWLAAVGWLAEDALDDTSPGLLIAPADGSEPPWEVAPELDRPVGSAVDTDLHGWVADSRLRPAWLDERTLIAVVGDRARQGPWRFDVDAVTGRASRPPRPLAAGAIAAYSIAVAAGGAAPPDGRVTMLACAGSRPMELLTVRAGAAEAEPRRPIRRTTMGGRWADVVDWPAMRLVEAPGPGGPIETWVASPAKSRDTPLPTIVDVHGGPLGAWTAAPSLEVVLLCARGYRVLLPNIRGSTTYGRGWIRPQLGDWGGVDAEDVHAAVDHAVSLGLADPERLGVMGWSYGGFMASWLAATSSRFRAAVSEAGVADQVSAWSGSDSGVEYNRMALLGTPLDPEGVDGLWRQSPLSRVAELRAPILLLQGEDDLRCPPSDAQQLFVALRVLGRTVEYVLYPEESHALQAGRPDRRIDRMTRVLDWFDRHVLDGGSAGS